MRRGLFGGTFDPVHIGHLDVARAARRALNLDEVMLVPSNIPPHRSTPHASAAHRFAMAALAVQGENGLVVSDVEMLAPGPSYTSATLDRLAARGIDTRTLVFVTGADAFREIATWKGYPHILDRCHFVVVSRSSSEAPALRTLLPILSERMIDAPSQLTDQPRIFLVNAPTAPISSTDVRRRIAQGASVVGLVPAAVAGHIVRHGLYTATGLEQGAS